MSAAARVGDQHSCPKHPAGPIVPRGCATVFIGGRRAARVGDRARCGGAHDEIVMGEPTVLVGNRMAARVGDPLDHGGVIVEGCPTVFIGSSAQHAVAREASRRGAAFAEECPRADSAVSGAPDEGDSMREASRRGTAFVEECPRSRAAAAR